VAMTQETAMQTHQDSYLVSDTRSERDFRTSFDREAFTFRHHLIETGLFSFDAILELADRVARKPSRWYFEEGATEPGKGWSARTDSQSLLECLHGLRDRQAFAMLKRVHEEPEYNEILQALQAELTSLTGINIPAHYRDGLMTIIIASPGRITPYHIDGEANLLMQMSGSKSVYIFDGKDREILPMDELERFWSGDIKAPQYREHLQNRARHFELVPGIGVHNPVIFPHWVQNGPDVSISLSVNFKRRVDDAADAHRVNRQLRKLGLHPSEPGTAKIVDHTKGVVYRTVRQVKRRLTNRSS
jgi:hypothetical protein